MKRQRRYLKQLALFALLLWVASGCYLPIRQTPQDSREYYPATPELFTPGESSRTDVLLAMGEPDDASPDQTVLSYRWSSIDGIIVVSQCTPPIELQRETVITFSFDEHGILQSAELTAG